jgi:Ser/Thr protein kinase RdoA (MazF antagonist)
VKAFPAEVARAALAHWATGPRASESLARLATSGNDVWRFTGDDGPRILRLTDRAWRTPAQNAAECAFLVHARACGAQVSTPVPSAAGALVETLDGVDASASVFTWAPGERLQPGDPRRDAAFHREWGRALAVLHEAATTYDGPPRWEWRDEGLLVEADALLPPDAAAIRAQRDELYARLLALPRGRDAYGLIHADFAPQNFHYADGRITSFDFGNLCRHWFVQDLAISFSTLRRDPARDRLRAWILEGYASVRALDAASWAERDAFLQLRALYVYLSRLKKFGPSPTADERATLATLRTLVEERVSWP